MPSLVICMQVTESTINVGTFLIVNFPFISSNILAAPAHGIHISQFIR